MNFILALSRANVTQKSEEYNRRRGWSFSITASSMCTTGEIRVLTKCSLYIQFSAVLRILIPCFSPPLEEWTKYPLLLKRVRMWKNVFIYTQKVYFSFLFISTSSKTSLSFNCFFKPLQLAEEINALKH